MKELARAAALPVACAVLLTGLLVAWVLTGGAGTIHRVHVEVRVSQTAGRLRAALGHGRRASQVRRVARTVRSSRQQILSGPSSATRAARVFRSAGSS